MAARKLNPDTVAIISAIEQATGAAQIVATSVSKELEQHTKHDDERFEQLTVLVESIALDVKSLLASRSFIRGAWKTIVTVAAAVSGAVALIPHVLSYLKGH